MERTAGLVRTLLGHEPADAAEARSLRRILAMLAWLPRPLDQEADPTHVTVSAIVRSADAVLLHRHRRLGVWLQPGGHIEPGETPEQAVLREVREETGLVLGHPAGGAELVHVDVHEGGRGHVHLDLRYRLEVPSGGELRPAPGESRELGWFDRSEATAVTDRSAAAAIDAAFSR